MSDPNTATRVSLGDVLRGLPPATPERDGWATLAAQLATARAPRPSRRVWPLALAATMMLCVFGALGTYMLRTPSVIATHAVATVTPAHASIPVNGEEHTHTTTSTSSDADRLDALRTRSQTLERWLRQTAKSGSPLQGQDLAAATEIENLIGLVDVELSGATSAHATELWQRRVSLLEDLAVLRYSNYQLAVGGKRLAANARID